MVVVSKKKKTSSNASLPDVFRRGEKLCSAKLFIGKYIIAALIQNCPRWFSPVKYTFQAALCSETGV